VSSVRTTWLRALVLPVAIIVGGFACNGVFGITEAAVDPTLGASDSGADAGDSAPPGDPTSCNAYCDAIDTNCKDTNAEYTSIPTCNAMCLHFEPGKPGEQTNDSLACRLYYTQQARTTPGVDCQQAGPLAAGKCVADPCSSFCTLAFNLCGPLELFPYKDEAECRTLCARWPYLTAADAGAGPVGDILFAAGDTLNCRLYHLESAYEVGNPSAAPTHCRHISDPSSTCR
jgi:hypothetical protein